MTENAVLLFELGAVIVGLALLARLASRIRIPAIPLYLLAGLAFGEGGALPLLTSQEFIEVGAQMGLILLLFMLGLEYSAAELRTALARSAPTAGLDLTLNFVPGFAAGLLLGWGPIPAAFLGGITYVSSSGIIAKLLYDFRRMGNRETPVILSLLVTEDLVMAVYLPVMAGLLFGGMTARGLLTVALAIAGVLAVLWLALRMEVGISRLIFSRSDEALLLSILGLALVVAALAESIQASAAVGALLAGIVLSGPAAREARGLLAPLRDLFAALFFVFFGLSIDPSEIPAVLGPVTLLALVTGGTKFLTGWWSAKWTGVGPRGRIRAGSTMIARGEFSIAIAAVAAPSALEPALGPVAAAYVLMLAVSGPLMVRLTEPIAAARRRTGEHRPRDAPGP